MLHAQLAYEFEEGKAPASFLSCGIGRGHFKARFPTFCFFLVLVCGNARKEEMI